MKKISKILTLSLISTFIIGICQMQIIRAETLPDSIRELQNLNDPGWDEFISNIDFSKEATTEEYYVKIYESEEDAGEIKEEIYTYDEYIDEINKPQTRAYVKPVSWLKFVYQIYPMYVDMNKASVLVNYMWLTTPKYQMEDIFTISSDSTAVIPGSNSKVNVAYWPNSLASDLVVSYSNRTPDGFESSDFSKFDFKTNGISFKQSISGALDTKVNNAIKNSKYAKNKSYFTANKYGIYTTNGNPKGCMGFTVMKPSSTSISSKILFTYHHKQVSGNFKPSISIGSSGSVSIGGFTGGVGYDKASTSIDYNWGVAIN